MAGGDTTRWRRVDELVARALDLEGTARAEMLERACGDDAELRAEVEGLLAGSGRLGGFLRPEHSPVHELEEPPGPDPWLDRTVEGFVLRQRIGSGGMGSVYEAWQERPGRKAAVKVLKRRFARDAELRRFEHEAAILARLAHPNVAHLYASGLVEDPWEAGQRLPWFAMELVDHARTITAHADGESLPRAARIELFLEVCGAVHHAHQRGVLHRDLKPSNILVDGEGRPKVIDFGIARALDEDVSAHTRTAAGQVVGTLQYMSPQQVGAGEVDVRCDVYSLGMVLYELLTGRRAYEISDTTLYEAVRIIREEPPRRPSAGDPSLRGDLETILLKAIDKDPDRRYASVHALGADLRRFLDHEPITARPPSVAYRLRLFARRNPLAALALSAAVLFLVGGAITSTVLFLQERRALRESERQQRVADAISDFLREDLLGALDPTEYATPDLRIREVLDRAGASIAGRFPGEPLVEAEVRRTIAQAYDEIGLPNDARPHLVAALERFEEAGEARSDSALFLREALVLNLARGGLFEESRAELEALRGMVEGEDVAPALAWRVLHAESFLLHRMGRSAEALPIAVEAGRLARAEMGEEFRDTLSYGAFEALLLMELGRLEEAADLHQTVLDRKRAALGPDDPNTINSLANFALVRQEQGRYDEACAMLEEAVERGLRSLGPDSAAVLNHRRNLALAYLLTGRLDEAAEEIESVHASALALLGGDDSVTLAAGMTLGSVALRQGRPQEASEVLQQSYGGALRTLGPQHVQTLETALHLARAQYEVADAEGACLLLEEALAAVPEPDEAQRETVLALMNTLGKFRMRGGELEQAVDILARTAERMRAWYGVHVGTASSLFSYGGCLLRLGRLAEAEEVLLEAHGIAVEIFGPGHGNTRQIAKELARVYDAQGRPEEAEALRAGP